MTRPGVNDPPARRPGLARRLLKESGRASLVYLVLMVIAFGSAVIAAYAWPPLLQAFGDGGAKGTVGGDR